MVPDYHGRADLLGSPVLHASDHRLADRATPLMELLVGVLVPLLTPEVGLVHLDRAGHLGLSRPLGKCLPDALHEVPCGSLADAKLTVELHARGTFEPSGHHVDGDHPLLEPQLAGLHYRALTHAEVLPAAAAPVAHGLAVGGYRVAVRTAIGAGALTVGPPQIFEPLFGGCIVGEHAEQLDDAESFAVPAARAAALTIHASIVL